MGLIAVVWSGLVATTLATAWFWLVRSFGWTRFSPSVELGCLFTEDPRRPLTETIGFGILFVFGSTVAPALFRAVLSLLPGPAWIAGASLGGLFGLLLAGLLPTYGTISACVREGVIPPPGRFGIGWGKSTPAILLTGHMIYGVVVATIQSGF